MSYIKHNFTVGEKLKASALNDMDDQIALNEASVNTIEDMIGDISSILDEIIGNSTVTKIDSINGEVI